MTIRSPIHARSAALAATADARALLPVIGLLLSVLVLILEPGAAWLHVT